MQLTDILRAAAQRMRTAGIHVEVNRSFGWVAITCKGEEDIFMQGDEADEFMEEVRKIGARCTSLAEDTIELALAEPYTDLWA